MLRQFPELTERLKAVACLLPVVLISLCDMHREWLITLLGGYDGYVAFRVSLYALFFANFCMLFSKGSMPCGDARNANVPQQSQRDPLLGLRFVAFMMVFLGHWFIVAFAPLDIGAKYQSQSLYWLLGSSPWAGVWIFFTLSGYLMAKGFISGRYLPNRTAIKLFFQRRALRILPVYLSALLIVGVFTYPAMFRYWNASDISGLIDPLTFDSRGNGPIGLLWSIGTEFQYYLIAPFIFIVFKSWLQSMKRILIGFAIVATGFGSYKYAITYGHGLTQWHAFVLKPMVANLDTFLFGSLTAYAVDRCQKNGFSLRYGLSLGLVVLAFFYLCISYISGRVMITGTLSEQELFSSFGPILTGLMTCAIIVLFELRDKSRIDARTHASKTLWAISTQGGLLTYVLYVWSEPVMLSLRKVAPDAAKLVAADSLLYFLVMGVPLTLIVGAFFYYAVEIPSEKKRQSLT